MFESQNQNSLQEKWVLLKFPKMLPIYVHNPILSKFGKLGYSVRSLSGQTGHRALHSYPEEIDLLVFSSFTPEVYTGENHLAAKICSDLKLENIVNFRMETASSSGAAAIHVTHELLQGGRFRNALVIGTEIMSRLDRNTNNVVLGRVLSEMEQSFSLSMMQGAAMICNRYLHKYSYQKKDLFFIAEKLHANGMQNPVSHIKKILSFEDYITAPIYSSPLGLYDISPISDGSAALILSSNVPSKCKICGLGTGSARFLPSSYDPGFQASRNAFKKAYTMAGISADKIQIAELHDAFTIFEAIGAEDAGFFSQGEALRNIKSGNTDSRGSLPINVSGGLKTRGHPIGASGIAQVVELANEMEKRDLKYGLTHSIGGLATSNFVTILERE